MVEIIPQVYSFVHAQLYLSDYDESTDYPPYDVTLNADNTFTISGEYLGYRANLTTFNINHNLSRIYNLGLKVPAELEPMRFEGRATMEFIPVSVDALEKFANLSKSNNNVLRQNLLVKLGGNEIVYGLEGIVTNRMELSVREGDVATIRADSVYRQIRKIGTTITVDESGTPTNYTFHGIVASALTDAPLVFKDISMTWDGKSYVVRELTATINSGQDVAYALGDRRYAVVWQGRQEIELTFNVYMDASSLADFMDYASVHEYVSDDTNLDDKGYIGEPLQVGMVVEHPYGGGVRKMSFSGVKIHSLGIPIRVGELIMLNVTAYAKEVSIE